MLGPETLNFVRSSIPIGVALMCIRSVAVNGVNQFVGHDEKRGSAAYV